MKITPAAKKICILDYGSGNVGSVYNIMSLIHPQTKISNSVKDIKEASHLILPGVGAFAASMKKIKKKLPLKLLEDQIFVKKKPFLGICVGMQVLADRGLEFGEHRGLGWVQGVTKKLNSKNLPLPHIGWNNIKISRNNHLTSRYSQHPDFYFVHSYVMEPKDKKDIVATTRYGDTFCSILKKENILGVQFHPEKSQKAGQILLENFIEM